MTIGRLPLYQASRAIEDGRKLYFAIHNKTKKRRIFWHDNMEGAIGKFTGWKVYEIPEELFNQVKEKINEQLQSKRAN